MIKVLRDKNFVREKGISETSVFSLLCQTRKIYAIIIFFSIIKKTRYRAIFHSNFRSDNNKNRLGKSFEAFHRKFRISNRSISIVFDAKVTSSKKNKMLLFINKSFIQRWGWKFFRTNGAECFDNKIWRKRSKGK